jgi:PBP1b-binding outer membrane lipoprotein LpoB
MSKFASCAALLSLTVLVGGCSKDRVAEYINAKFPPVTMEAQQQAALKAAAATRASASRSFDKGLGETVDSAISNPSLSSSP